MKLDALDHPKTFDFASRLGVELPTALGHLELLWAFTGKQASQGNVGKWPDGAIARACYWMGDPVAFIRALHESGFIDADPAHRFIVHDWQAHAPGWVRAKLKKLGLSFISTSEPSSDASSDASAVDPEPSSESSSRAHVLKGREEKRREELREQARAVLGLDTTAWDRWLEYRASIGKPIKPPSLLAAATEFASHGSGQAAAVQHSIANSYQGLFAPKSNGKPQPPPKRERPPTEAEIAEARRRAAADNASAMQKLGLGGVLKGMPQ